VKNRKVVGTGSLSDWGDVVCYTTRSQSSVRESHGNSIPMVKSDVALAALKGENRAHCWAMSLTFIASRFHSRRRNYHNSPMSYLGAVGTQDRRRWKLSLNMQLG